VGEFKPGLAVPAPPTPVDLRAVVRFTRPLVLIVSAGLALGVDVATKRWAETALDVRAPVPVVGDVLQLTLGYNTGIAFGLFARGGGVLLAGIGLVILAVFAVSIVSLRRGMSSATVGPLGLITGGAIANLVDRLDDERVTDFIDAGIGVTRWPAFNLADTAIVIGVAVLVVTTLMREQDEPVGAEARS